MPNMKIIDLPEDILFIIFSSLDPSDFLSLCRSSRVLYSEYRQDPLFWRTKTSDTFRLPISPLLKADGARWYWLYKRLRTQTKLYTWGQGKHGDLGRGRPLALPVMPRMRRGPPRRGPPFERITSSWPTEVDVPDGVGVVADLQCGGFSTLILNAQGKLYCTGSIDSADGRVGPMSLTFERLEYLTQSTTAISQFSAGRKHVLALTDDGDILSWDRVRAKGLKITSRSGTFGGRPSRVVAGWVESSAYIPEVGIIYWHPVQNDQPDVFLDGVNVMVFQVPNTAYRKVLDANDFDVPAHVLLEGYIVWITTENKVFACSASADISDPPRPSPLVFQLPGYDARNDEIQDIRGSYRNFVVLTKLGRVLAGDVDYIRRCEEVAGRRSTFEGGEPRIASDPSTWQEYHILRSSRPRDIRALQHTGVINVSFGDYHYHALHANGKITTYGKDSDCCGQLGLGEARSAGRLRGVTLTPALRPDGVLLPVAELTGRQIWFEPEKKDWLSWMSETLQEGRLLQQTENGAQAATQLLMGDRNRQAMFSEWVEREGRHWDQGPGGSAESDSGLVHTASDDFSHLDPYFAISVSAAGWHSGALVLVDQEKALQVRQKWTTTITHDQPEDDVQERRMPGHFEAPKADPQEEYIWKIQGFPKVALPDGFELPGVGEPRPWKDGMPSLEDLGIGSGQ